MNWITPPSLEEESALAGRKVGPEVNVLLNGATNQITISLISSELTSECR